MAVKASLEAPPASHVTLNMNSRPPSRSISPGSRPSGLSMSNPASGSRKTLAHTFRNSTAVAARAATAVEFLLPGATGESLAELSRSGLAAGRECLSMENQQRVTQAVADRDRQGGPDDPGSTRAEPDKGGDFDFGR